MSKADIEIHTFIMMGECMVRHSSRRASDDEDHNFILGPFTGHFFLLSEKLAKSSSQANRLTTMEMLSCVCSLIE